MREADDPLIPIEQIDNFVAARPTTQRVELEAAPGSDLGQYYLHGTMSENGRNQYRAALGSFVDRAAATYAAERQAARTGCNGVTRSLTLGGAVRVQQALSCLARADGLVCKAGARGARTLVRSVRGEVNAAREWTVLRSSMSGRRALAALAAGRASQRQPVAPDAAHAALTAAAPRRVSLTPRARQIAPVRGRVGRVVSARCGSTRAATRR